MRNLLTQLLAVGPELAVYIFSASLLHAQRAHAQNVVSSPDLDLQDLGRVAVGGDFNSISLYTYEGQNENLSSNGSQSLLTRYADGTYHSLALVDADASIAAMCPFVQKDGTVNGVIVGGNFTSLGGVQASSIALWNPATEKVEPLAGLTGPVRAVYCDQESQTVYVGGQFMAGNSTNAMAWITGWVNLPFAGFNGAVDSITKNSAGNIVFGGQFTGLGNASTPSQAQSQVISLGGGTIATSGTTTTAGFTDANSIICSTQESGKNWLLADNTGGWWEGQYGFGFVPTKLRLYNTVQSGHGTKAFYFENLNNGGILNFTYVDPTTGQTEWCIQDCPLPENNGTAQDFTFVNPIGMSQFRIYITEWYGASGGFSGIEMFTDSIFSFAVDSFNEPKCDGLTNGSSSSHSPATGTWQQKPNLDQTPSDYLSATLTSTNQVDSNTNVIFMPNIQQSGNYSVTMYTPGCILDGTCNTRGQVNVTVSMAAGQEPTSTTLYQTNNYEKFDQIYYGPIDIENFAPSVTLTPLSGQAVPLTVVASRVNFELINSTGGLNGLFEYNPNEVTVDTDFSASAINSAGASLNAGAVIRSVIEYDNAIYAAGSFSGPGMSNIMSIQSKAASLPGGGLNGAVMTMELNGSSLYIGGTFDNTVDGSVSGLNNLAVFSIPDNSWSALGAGVDGAVFDIVPLPLNVTTDDTQNCFAISGNFTSVNSFGGNKAFSTSGFAVWVPTYNNWLSNIMNATIALKGDLTAYTTVPDSTALWGGIVTSQGFDTSDVVELVGSGSPSLQSLGITLEQSTSNSSSSMQKRALAAQGSGQNYTGIYDGYFYQDNNLNITILGGSFSTTGTDGSTIQNLAFVNNTNSSQQTVSGVSGLTSDSIIVSMDIYGTLVFIGGAIEGTIQDNTARGLIVYDVSTNNFPTTMPPALGGEGGVVVNAVSTQPQSSLVFVGGQFDTAGALECSTLCSYDAAAMQWQSVGFGLTGTINAMFWASNTELFIAGNLTVNGNMTTMATYDTKKQAFTEFQGASSLPGPITTISAVNTDYNSFWVSGIATSNSSAYLSIYANGAWSGVGGVGALSSIRKLQILSLTSSHSSSSLMADNQALLILGNINTANNGNASAVLFNGTTYEPYLLTTAEGGGSGSLSAFFVSNPGSLMSNENHNLALGLVVLIGLAISLTIIALMVATGFILERRRRRKEGYVPMSVDKSSNIARLPPEKLFSNLEGRPSPPRL